MGAEQIALLDLADDVIDDFGVVPAQQQLFRQAPHPAEQPVHACDIALPVDDQDAVAGRFQRRPQLRARIRKVVLDPPFLMHLARLHEQKALTGVLEQPHRLLHRQHRPVGAGVKPFLGLDRRAIAGAHFLPEEHVLQGAFDVEDAARTQFVLAVAEALLRHLVGKDNLQPVRLDEQDHLLGMIEQQADQTGIDGRHAPAASSPGPPTSK